MKIEPAEIAKFAADAGFAGEDLQVAVAVALAESGGDTTAHGDTNIGTGAGSLGLWQIYRDAHPEFAGLNLYDPVENAYAAYHVYAASHHTFEPWSTYNSGAYLKYMDSAAEVA